MEEDGIPTVRNRKETSYEATRMGTALQPYTYYGEFISLDGASAKGGGKAEYKSITPENVFFDDSKICFFNINLDRKGKKTEVTFKRTFHDLHYLYMNCTNSNSMDPPSELYIVSAFAAFPLLYS